MQFIFFLLSTLIMIMPNCALAQNGYHGMILFGGDVEAKGGTGVYIAHLPLLHGHHATHAGQLVAEVEFDEASLKSYLAHRTENPDIKLYSLNPLVAFDRSRDLGKTGFSFPAQIYVNHFENPPGYPRSIPLGKPATVTIKRVILNYELETRPSLKEANPRYAIFGNSNQQFAVRLFTSAPDYEHIVEVKLSDNLLKNMQKDFFQLELNLNGFFVPQTLNPDKFKSEFKKPNDGFVYQIEFDGQQGTMTLKKTNFFFFEDLRG